MHIRSIIVTASLLSLSPTNPAIASAHNFMDELAARIRREYWHPGPSPLESPACNASLELPEYGLLSSTAAAATNQLRDAIQSPDAAALAASMDCLAAIEHALMQREGTLPLLLLAEVRLNAAELLPAVRSLSPDIAAHFGARFLATQQAAAAHAQRQLACSLRTTVALQQSDPESVRQNYGELSPESCRKLLETAAEIEACPTGDWPAIEQVLAPHHFAASARAVVLTTRSLRDRVLPQIRQADEASTTAATRVLDAISCNP
ncbi:MAG: hypothetical protein J0L61_09355 [Planctomycetes bacterium]|nr:hypothetical protein [Planctomycetota bacterium]